MPRSSLWGPSAPGTVTSTGSVVRCHHNAKTASLSLRLAPVAPGSSPCSDEKSVPLRGRGTLLDPSKDRCSCQQPTAAGHVALPARSPERPVPSPGVTPAVRYRRSRAGPRAASARRWLRVVVCLTPAQPRVLLSLGRGAAPVWWNPRRRARGRQVCSSLAVRQAPDGGKEGGSQPTDISVINRRVLLAPALPIDKRKNQEADVKKLLPTLDIGSHINARRQARLEAGARHEWTLAVVACTPILGKGSGTDAGHSLRLLASHCQGN